jgi:hypothetical protein
MATTGKSKSAAVRARLTHPVIDSDGHMIEFEPGFCLVGAFHTYTERSV